MKIVEFDNLEEAKKLELLFNCCGSTIWVDKMLAILPVENLVDLLEHADKKWLECEEKDWLEAFKHHPKIGDIKSLKEKFVATLAWASNEQLSVNEASDEVIEALAKGNQDYQNKYGFIFIVCATGKSAKEMLDLLTIRLSNLPEKEIKIAAAEQQKITTIRLGKLFV